ncbi:ScbR family autoregulator-binding transcription factor [Rhodococcus aetherivorans]|uniref:ScbR family autoregulator-binding transcription factor n=1 Tax=Rhodococcus aetherivorans TaxID=191292 RepID=UPI0036B0819E
MVRQARAVATRQQILDGAAAQFERYGYEGAGLAGIVESIGVTKGALYFHFSSKDGLAQALIDEQHRRSIAAVDAVAALDRPALEQVVMLSYAMARQMLEDPIVRAGIRLTLELSATDGPPGPYLDWIAACRDLTARAVTEGDVRASIDPDVLARFVIAAYNGVQLVSNVLTGRRDLEHRLDQMWLLLLPGIVPADRHERIPQIRSAR